MWLYPVGLCPHHIPSWGSISPSVGCVEGDPGPRLPKEGQKILLCYPISHNFVQAVVPRPGYRGWRPLSRDTGSDGVLVGKSQDPPR